MINKETGNNIPEEILERIKDKQSMINDIGMSDSQVVCFDDMVLKIERECFESDNEHFMINWLKDKIAVPEIVVSKKMNTVNYLLMSRIQGKMACDKKYMEQPELLIKLLADGLKMLWNVNISDCPNDNSLNKKLLLAEKRVKNGLCSMEDAKRDTYGENGFKNPEELLQWLKIINHKKISYFLTGIIVFRIFSLIRTKLVDLLILEEVVKRTDTKILHFAIEV